MPKQHSTGGQSHWLGSSKRGDRDVHKLLMHGARATLRWVERRTDSRSQWIRGGSRVEGGTGRRWRTRMPGSCGPYCVGAASMVKARAKAASTRGGSTGLRQQQATGVVKSFPRKKAGQCQGRGKRQEVEVSCRTMRGVIEVMTREVRPASPEPVHVKGL